MPTLENKITFIYGAERVIVIRMANLGIKTFAIVIIKLLFTDIKIYYYTG